MGDRRWMVFLDGENFTIRAQELAKVEGLTLRKGLYHEPNVFVWMPGCSPDVFPVYCGGPKEDDLWRKPLQERGVRAHYYTSIVGSEADREDIRQRLWARGFSPYVFRKDKTTGRTKGVDITLTTDMLSHAFQDNYDVAFLVAGDGDYVPLVQEVKRLGKIVYVAFFDGSPEAGLSPELRLAADRVLPVNKNFLTTWNTELSKPGP